MSWYELLLWVHILGVTVWLGGSITLLYLASVTKAAGPQRMVDAFAGTDKVANRLMPPAAVLVAIAGVLMVLDSPVWGFAQFWITAGMTMFLVSAVLGSVFYGREGKRILARAEANGAEDPEVTARIARYANVARIEVLLLIVVVGLMVAKPGF